MENIVNESKRRKLDRPITGIIQEDRIWEQWYDQDIFKKELPKMTQKDYLFQCIGDEPNRIIINNRGMKTYTEEQFEALVKKYEKAFASFNLKKGDIICTIALTTPELYAIKYAATSLGLITCNLNVFDVAISDEEKNRLYRQLENVNPKMIFTLDLLEDKIASVINSEKFSNSIKVSMPLEKSTPIYNPERALIGLKVLKDHLAGKKIQNSLKLDDFLNLGNLVKDVESLEIYEEKLPCNISFTSGTTGINKAVLLSHDANNALAFQQSIGDFGFKRGTRNMALVPPFLAFWDADIVHAVLCQGGENIIELSLTYDEIPKYFKKHKNVNMGIWSQYLWEGLLTLPDKELRKISPYIKHAIIGGERCEENAAETFYKKTGIIQMTGFGASEVNTTFSITHPDCTKIGSAGIPLPFNNVKITDDSGNDITYGQPGKLYVTGPCLMNGYYNRDDLTKKAIFKDKNGIEWYKTGDYAVVDNDGCLTVLDRYSEPIIITYNGKQEKVNMLDIIEVIKKNKYIKNCKMTNHEEKMVLHLTFDPFSEISDEDALDTVINTIQTELPEKYWPNFISISEQLPRTNVGKVDYKALNKKGIEICEKNNSEEKLTVIKNDNKILTKRK